MAQYSGDFKTADKTDTERNKLLKMLMILKKNLELFTGTIGKMTEGKALPRNKVEFH